MKSIITLLLLSLSFISYTQETIDLVIWAGQSNALGRQGDAAGYPADPNNLDLDIRFNWEVINGNTSGGWTTMGPQVGYFPSGHFGPEVSFSRKLSEDGHNTAIFKFSLGATSIFEHWMGPGEGGFYDDLVTKLNAAITALENQGHTVNVIGFVWIQGESDSNSQAAADDYSQNLTDIINDLRNNVVNDPELPIILGVDEQYFNLANQDQPEILNAHEDIALNDANIRFTSMYGYPKADASHLTPAGLISHGEAIANTFISLLASETPLATCSLTSDGDNVSIEARSWGQQFTTDCSGYLSSFSFSAGSNLGNSATVTIHNGADCGSTVLSTHSLADINIGVNTIVVADNIYLDSEHTYYLNITSDNPTTWRVHYSDGDNVFGLLKTNNNGADPLSCRRSFTRDMNFSVEISSDYCTLSSSGAETSFDRASWGQSFVPNCSGVVSSISFQAPIEHNHTATFTLYNGLDCTQPVLYTQQLTSIAAGENIINFNQNVFLNTSNTYFFQIVTNDDSFWSINYSNTDNVQGLLRTFQNGSYCERQFPSFDMAFSLVLGSPGSCANNANIYSFTYDNKPYEIVKENKTWVAAAACAVARGGILTEINDQAEQDALFNELDNNAGIVVANTVAPDGGNASYVWIGANDIVNEDIWIWDGGNSGNGVQFWQGNAAGNPVGGLYNNWGNEPDDWNNQDAAGIGLTQWPINSGVLGSPGQWNDIDHENTLYYIIEYAPLPVELVSFEANIKDKTVALKWTTLTEENSDYYIIEHSTDGIIFTNIGQVNTIGNTQWKNNYNFIDKNPNKGINFYRLRIVDIDVREEISKTVSVNFINEDISVYPNPVHNKLWINYNIDKDYRFSLYNLSGQLVLSKTINTQTIDLKVVLPGVYYFIIRDNSGTIIKSDKLTKM